MEITISGVKLNKSIIQFDGIVLVKEVLANLLRNANCSNVKT